MQRKMSIKKTAKEIGICIQSSFDWRHKVLSVIHTEVPDTLEGRVECDEVELPINLKGERNLDRKARKKRSDFTRNTEDKERQQYMLFRPLIKIINFTLKQLKPKD